LVYVTGPVGAGAAVEFATVEFATNMSSAGAPKEVLAAAAPELDEDRMPDVVMVALRPVDVELLLCNEDD
jgi:hypothetical protein